MQLVASHYFPEWVLPRCSIDIELGGKRAVSSNPNPDASLNQPCQDNPTIDDVSCSAPKHFFIATYRLEALLA